MNAPNQGHSDKWRPTETGILVPTSSQLATGSPTSKASTRTAEHSTARATWVTASIAVIALIISGTSALLQLENNQRDRRENAARVQTWWTLDFVIIQNSSTMPVTSVYINWVNDGEFFKMLVVNEALPPCTRWTFSKSSPELAKAERSHALIGITFIQDGEVWAVENFTGALQGPDMELLNRPNLGLLEWRNHYAKVDAASVCAS
ncbi:hypothetical protein AB0B88_23650 [Micromonospora haikouensis]|uniref:hypothetical protein n=1 Tax=Micromonospora haikouensis TaxID=686309 RepID=UPI0033DF7E15